MPRPLHQDFLTHADSLIQNLGAGRPAQIVLRRIISASYYAAWHCICDEWASKFDSRLQQMLCRCPQHTKVKQAAGNLRSGKNKWLDRRPCSEIDQLCEDFITLQVSRHDADYDVAMNFRRADATGAYQRAKRIIETVQWARTNNTDEMDALLLDSLGIKTRHS